MTYPEYGSAPIKCAKRSCTWRGHETGRMKPLPGAANRETACPFCGCREYYFMTDREIKNWQTRQVAK